MRWRTRLSLVWDILWRREVKAARPRFTRLDPAAAPAQRDLAALPDYIADGFEGNAIIYAAIMYKVRALIVAPLKAYLGTPEQPLVADPLHPLAQLLRRPNPWQSALEFRSLITVFLNLAGNAFVWFDRPTANALPSRMFVLWPDRVKVIPGPDNDLLGFWYTPEGVPVDKGIPILPEDMAHLKLPNASDRKLMGMGPGMSPVKPMALAADTDNAVTTFVRRFFAQGTMLGALLTFDVPLNDDDAARLKQRWREQYGGVDHAGDVGVLDAHGKFQRIGQTFEEMDFTAVDERSETRILGPLGVAPILIGARSGLLHGTYSNYEQARRATWEDTIDPELSLIEDELAYYLATPDGAFPMHDRSRVPALRRDIGPLTTAFADLVAAGVPPKIAAETVGLPLADYPGSDRSRTAAPPGAAQPEQEAPPTEEQPSPEGPDNADATEDTRKAAVGPRRFKQYDPAVMSQKVDQVAADWESQFGDAALSQIESDLREVLALVNDTQKAARRNKAGINWRDLEQPVKEYLEGKGAEAWRDTFVPLIEGAMLDAAEEWAVALGIQFNVRNLRGEAWFQDYVLKFAQPINQTTSDAIHEVIEQALADGWSNRQMEDRLEQLFKQWMKGNLTPEDFQWLQNRLPPYRREMIARTESMHASNAGAFNHFKEWGVNKKTWRTSIDGRQRKSHEAANGQSRPIDEPFEVGTSKLMFPLDSSLGASADEIVDCRCAVLPVVD